MEKLILIDGNSLINRAYYAVTPLTDREGHPTNAIYGFVNMLVKVLLEEKPTHMLVAFDRREPTFRHKMYDNYKGNRKPMPEDLRPQIPMLKELLTIMGISIYDQAGIEADDIIGTLAKKFKIDTKIITGDKDSFQLVDQTTSVYFTKRGISDVENLTYLNFKEIMGIDPYQIIELKSVMGDSSDNYPGVNGIGEKGAYTLIQEYGTLENIYAHIDEIKGKVQEKLLLNRDEAFLCHTLATIKTDCDIDLKLEDLLIPFPFNNDVKQKFISLDFKNIIKRDELFLEKEKKIEIIVKNVQNIDEISQLLSKQSLALVIGDNANIYDLDGIEYVVSFKQSLFDEGLAIDEFIYAFKDFLEDTNKEIICYSKKALAKYLEPYGVKINCRYQDVDILRYLVDFSGKEENILNVIDYYGLSLDTPAYSLYSLYEDFYGKVKEQGIDGLYNDIELPLSSVLSSMEDAGFKVDLEVLSSIGNDLKVEINESAQKINSIAGREINANSPKQLGEYIFDELKLGKGKKTKTGAYSTNAEVLEELKDKHEIIPVILRHRFVQKLYSTYVEGIREAIDNKTGLVHTIFNQTLTNTGRLSSKEPNLQNIPIREEEGRLLRKFFVVKDKGNVLIDADYSQIELRLLAHMSGDEVLVNAFNSGIDIHTKTAATVFGVKEEDVTSEMRRAAKAVNFGIIYGISEYGLATQLGIGAKQAKEYIDNYFATFPSIKNYLNDSIEFAKKNGYAKTLYGRRRYIREISSQNYNLRQFGERVAMNMPLQGTAADIIKIAMVNVYNRLKKEGLKTQLIMQVHDELILEAPIAEKEIAMKILVEEMENVAKLKVPLLVEAKEGRTWFETK